MTIEQIFALIESKKSFHFDIEPLRHALVSANLEYLKLKCIHIAGTNGKGSTTNYLRAIISKAYPKYKVGTFTSPYLEVHNDRIRINDQFISDDDFVRLFLKYMQVIDNYELSMFEIDMFLSVAYFIEQQVDIVIYETGLGGELDATNVIVPILSVITNIGYDHMDFLGDTLSKIAQAKAGIIKQGVPLVTSEHNQECLEVFRKVCTQLSSTLHLTETPVLTCTSPIIFKYQQDSFELSSQALYQVQNASLAIEVVKVLNTLSYNIDMKDVKYALLNTIWKGRFEELIKDVYVDGAHNLQGIRALCETVSNFDKEVIVVFAALRDKPVDEMIDMLSGCASHLILTTFDFYRARQADDYTQSDVYLSYQDAIDNAISNKNDNQIVVITGSLYFISVARHYVLGGKYD